MWKISKRVVLLFVMSFYVASISMVYSQTERERIDFKQEKREYFSEQLKLSENEKEAFWPIYDDRSNRRMKINEDEKSLLTYFSSNSDYLSKSETDETINTYFDIQQRRVDQELLYHDKYIEVIGKKKTMQLYAMEREYRMQVLRKFRGQGPGSQGRHRNARQ